MPTTSAGSSWRACMLGAQRTSRVGEVIRPYPTIQTRGKKSYTKTKTVAVRLREDLPGFGKKGSVVPVVKGQMRNIYFPQRIADYISLGEKRDLKRKNVVIERDVTFGSLVAEEGAEIKEVETRLVNQPARSTSKRVTPVRVQLDTLEPSESYTVLSRLLPETIVFYRTPIAQPAESASPVTPQPTSSPEESAGPSHSLYPSRTSTIYGSVSSGDVATSVKALIAASPDAAGRIIIGEDDIRFVGGSEDRDRVKQLGNYDIDIRIKGHSQAIRRKLSVLAEDEADMDIDAAREAVDLLAGETPVKEGASERVAKIEAELRESAEAVSALTLELQDLEQNGRLAKDPVTLTPAEEAEIEARGDSVPPVRGKVVVVEEEGEDTKRRRG